MKLFIDTANVDEIRAAAELGVICGVTTNPSLIAREGRDFVSVIKEITTIVDGPISAEVVAPDAAGMLAEARKKDTRYRRGTQGCTYPLRRGHTHKCNAYIQRGAGAACRKSRSYVCKPVHRQT